MRLYIIRHADPDYPNNTITEQGHREAAALAERLAAERLDRLYSSPLQRALDTARYTQEAGGMTPVVEGWMAELSDWHLDQEPWKGLVTWDLPGEVIRGDEVFPGHDTWHDLAHLLAIPLTLMWSGFWMAPSSVTTILFDERSPEWAVPRCIGFCDVSHLYAAGLPVQPRGILANFD